MPSSSWWPAGWWPSSRALSAWVVERRAATGARAADRRRAAARASVYLTGIYGGYFGAARRGVIRSALLSILIDDDLQRLNGLKNVITTVINSVAAIIFILG